MTETAKIHETAAHAAEPALQVIDELEAMREECAWIRRKLDLPPNATRFDVYGRMHVWDSHQHGYLAYIAAYKCNHKQGEIARLSAELHAAHREVESLLAAAAGFEPKEQQ